MSVTPEGSSAEEEDNYPNNLKSKRELMKKQSEKIANGKGKPQPLKVTRLFFFVQIIYYCSPLDHLPSTSLENSKRTILHKSNFLVMKKLLTRDNSVIP